MPEIESITSVAALISRARRHDDAAAEALVAHLYPTVMKIVRSHLPRRAAEEDLAQEVFIKVFRRLDQYEARDGVPVEHWVSRIAVTTCLDALRMERRRPEWRQADLSETEAAWLEYFTGEESAEADAPDADAEAIREVMLKLLALLPPQDRLVLQLLDLEGKPVREISRMTGWGESLIKVRAFRARRRLRTAAMKLRKEFL